MTCFKGCFICSQGKGNSLRQRIALLREQAAIACEQGDYIRCKVLDGQVQQLVVGLLKNGVREAA